MTEDGRDQVSARVTPAVLARLDAVAVGLAERLEATMPGAKAPTRADAVRAALERGLALLEADLGISSPAPKKKGTKAARAPRK